MSLTELGLVEPLFSTFSKQLAEAGYVARKGQIVDASLVTAPIQRNSREENIEIKQGNIPKGWKENKSCQQDTQARWTKRNGKSYYGYKNYINVDNQNKLIRDYDVTDASVHESQVFDKLLDPENSSADVWVDSANRSAEIEEQLNTAGYRSKIHRKGSRQKPLSYRERQGNGTRSKIRCRVEHIFGAQTQLRQKAIRSIGLARAKTEIGMMNVVYNMRRYCFLQRNIVC